MMMVLKRESLRLRNRDYSTPGYYFVTVLTRNRECLFGEISKRQMILNPCGEIVKFVWMGLPNHYFNVELDTFVVMPNHFHGILILKPFVEDVRAGFPRPAPVTPQSQGAETAPLRPIPLGQVVAYFKYQSTKHINLSQNTPGRKIWHRNYYDRIIRDEKELSEIRTYIEGNPIDWHLHPENPDAQT